VYGINHKLVSHSEVENFKAIYGGNEIYHGEHKSYIYLKILLDIILLTTCYELPK
jgi:hypothetical protein